MPKSMVNRRRFLQSTAATAFAVTAGTHGATASAHVLPELSGAQPSTWFAHGVASGDPTPSSVILWTRMTPTPEAVPGSGLGPDTPVIWEVALDAAFTSVVSRGTALASAAHDHTVHVDPGGLAPATRYFYRFTAPNGTHSALGRTTTTTLVDAPLTRLCIALASCANWESGFFAAYEDISRRALSGELDVLVFLGDYIYEYARGRFTGKHGAIRSHEPEEETVTLTQYRTRYGHYRTDPQLQAAHAALPWITMWDDHETANDSWRDGSANHHAHQGPWNSRKQAGHQAYMEWMPVRTQPISEGGHLYRSFSFGNLVHLSMLDLRSFRDAPPTPAQWFHGQRSGTLMGTEQFQWLKHEVESSTPRWNIIGSSVMFAPMQVTGNPHFQLPDPLPANLDQWDGYSRERDRLLSVLAGTGKPTLFLAGDIHSEWANAISYAGTDIGVELVCSSITAPNVDDHLNLPENNAFSLQTEAFIRANRPQVRHVDVDSHGYAIAELSHDDVHLSWIRVHDITRADSPISTSPLIQWNPVVGFTS